MPILPNKMLPDISASRGHASEGETREALGAYVLAQAGYPSAAKFRAIDVQPGVREEVWEMDYKRRTWRIVLFLYAGPTGKDQPRIYRMHFDNIRYIESEGSDPGDDPDYVGA